MSLLDHTLQLFNKAYILFHDAMKVSPCGWGYHCEEHIYVVNGRQRFKPAVTSLLVQHIETEGPDEVCPSNFEGCSTIKLDYSYALSGSKKSKMPPPPSYLLPRTGLYPTLNSLSYTYLSFQSPNHFTL